MNSITYIGMDVHTTNYTLCAFTLQTQTPSFELQIRPEFEELKKCLKNLDKALGGNCYFICGYEAVCLGYSLYKEIMGYQWKGFHVECVIMAPSTMAISPNDKMQKSDSKDARWIARTLCFGQYKKEFEIVPTEADIVRTIFRLYNEDGWGYKRIANHLTDQGIPTPRMSEQMRKEVEGETTNRKTNTAWAIVTVQGILDNDFYIGTLRQAKYTRAKINGKDVKREEEEHIVIENHHQPIIDYRTFATTRALREKRSTSNYRGVKKYDNVYSGFLFCGDCGSPMFAMSRKDLSPAYTCGTYHRRGRSGCSSHHIRVDRLDELLKIYVKKVKENSHSMLDRLNADLEREQEDVSQTEQSADRLAEVLLDLQEELKATKRQRIRDIMKHPEQEALLEETYDEMESELQNKIQGISHQIEMLADRRNTILQINRVAKTALDVFDDILNKDALDRNDLELIIQKILVYENRLEIYLQADIDTLIRTEALEDCINFKEDIEDISLIRFVQTATHRKDKVFDVNVISEGEELCI